MLSIAARRNLAAPPTSVPSERMFSDAGQIYTKKRNRLDGNRAELQFLFLKTNLPKLNYEYSY